MSTQTKRGLIKPDRDDNYSVEVFNDNCDRIEEILDSYTVLAIPITNWIEGTDPKGKTYYYQTFTVNGLKSGDTPIISRKGNDIYDVTDESDMQKAYNCLSEYECGENTITLFAHKVPTTAFTILLKGVGV